MKIGYARVSTEDQNLSLQRDALTRAGCDRVAEEKASGATTRRPALNAALKGLKRGDVLVVWKLDRLGRSLQDLISILSRLERRGIDFCSLSDAIDTTTPCGKLLFHITGAVAEFERALISERTKAGMQAARLQGKVPGRRYVLGPAQRHRVLHMAVVDDMPFGVIAKEMRVSVATVRRIVVPFRRDCAGKHLAALKASHASSAS